MFTGLKFCSFLWFVGDESDPFKYEICLNQELEMYVLHT